MRKWLVLGVVGMVVAAVVVSWRMAPTVSAGKPCTPADVTVTLTDIWPSSTSGWTLAVSFSGTTTLQGSRCIQITNSLSSGTTHAVEVENTSTGQEWLSPRVSPGKTIYWQVNLPTGVYTYEVYCPMTSHTNHETAGMCKLVTGSDVVGCS